MSGRFVVLKGLLFSVLFFVVILAAAESGYCVNSEINRHGSSADFLKGKADDILVSSKGVLQLGRGSEILVEEFEKVWSINSLVVDGETIYVGTSPNGGIYKYSSGILTKIYPDESQEEVQGETVSEPNEVAEPNDANTVKTEEYLTNEHIFAMARDKSGRLLAGISGNKCRLVRQESGKMVTVFEPNDAKYIFAIAFASKDEIYLGTGPNGKIYMLNVSSGQGELFYDSEDKNILSLAVGADGAVYAGSDSRGLIYRIDAQTKDVKVLYDSEQPEVTALLFGTDGELYAAATSAQVVETQNKFASQLPFGGRPEAKAEKKPVPVENSGQRKLQIPNTKDKTAVKEGGAMPTPSMKGRKPDKASYVYKVTKEGYVTEVFSENAVLFCLAGQKGGFIVGTGNNGQLYSVDPSMEEQAIIYEDKQASQLTAAAVLGDDLYIGTANPAKLIKLGSRTAGRGSYASDLIDASQPARWGKLQIDADIPEQCRVLVSSRSGNVKDVNDPTFSKWTDEVEVSDPVQLQCPNGRFCQYKLVFESTDGKSTPLVREVAVAHSVPNLAPKIEDVTVVRIPTPDKAGVFKVGYKSEDANKDKLIYKISFRKSGRTNWIEVKDELEEDSYDWDGRTVEDGRYEVRVEASDERDNTSETRLTGSRISDPVVVDNTPPYVKKVTIKKGKTGQGKADVTMSLTVRDDLSVIGKVYYTLDSDSQWKGAVPEDLVYDSLEEDFSIRIEGVKAGDHIVSLKISDDLGNTMYKTLEVGIQE